MIEKNPAQHIKTKFFSKEKHKLTLDQLTALYNTACKSDQLKNAFLFSCYMGLQKSDIINLRQSHIKNGYLNIITQKTKSQVKVKLHPVALEILKKQELLISETVEYCQKRNQYFDSERIFSIQTGGRGTTYLRDWFKKAGVESASYSEENFYSFHTARHTFVSNIAIYSGNVLYAQKLVGHRDIKTTQIYTHTEQDILDTAIHSLPDLDGQKY